MEATLYQMVSSLLMLTVLLALLSIVFISWKNGISPMPSSAPVRRMVMKEIKRLPSEGIMVEAGSGWGTVALQAAKVCPGWKVIGIENSLIPLWVSRIAARLDRRGKYANQVTFIGGDLYSYQYENADLVVCYLYPGAMKRLSVILRDQLAPNAQIISICFALPGWEPEQIITCTDTYRTKVYLYKA